MKNIKIICAFILISAVFSTVLLTSCGKQESFVPVSVTTTSPQTTEAETFIYREFDIFGAKMGMSLEETQQAIGAPVELYTNESNTMYFVVNKKDLPFVNRDLEASVYFIPMTDSTASMQSFRLTQQSTIISGLKTEFTL